MSEDKAYKNFLLMNGEFIANKFPVETHEKLVPGAYTISYNPEVDRLSFDPFNITNDKLIDLPSSEYDQVVGEMNRFLSPDVKARFKERGYVYKRSCLLHGAPGTGKTCIVNRVCQNVIKQGGVVLFVDHPKALELAFAALEQIQPDVLTLVIFEEFDNLVKRFGDEVFCVLLDGQVQKDNVIYLATTNYLDKIPARLRRPGRMSSVIEAGLPNEAARRVYLETQLGKNYSELLQWVHHTQGLTIDELKEMVQSVDILGNDFVLTLKRIHNLKGVSEESSDDDNDNEDGPFSLDFSSMLMPVGRQSLKRKGQ